MTVTLEMCELHVSLRHTQFHIIQGRLRDNIIHASKALAANTNVANTILGRTDVVEVTQEYYYRFRFQIRLEYFREVCTLSFMIRRVGANRAIFEKQNRGTQHAQRGTTTPSHR